MSILRRTNTRLKRAYGIWIVAENEEKRNRRRIRISLVVMQYKQKGIGLKVLRHTNQTKLTNDQKRLTHDDERTNELGPRTYICCRPSVCSFERVEVIEILNNANSISKSCTNRKHLLLSSSPYNAWFSCFRPTPEHKHSTSTHTLKSISNIHIK